MTPELKAFQSFLERRKEALAKEKPKGDGAINASYGRNHAVKIGLDFLKTIKFASIKDFIVAYRFESGRTNFNSSDIQFGFDAESKSILEEAKRRAG